MALIFDSLTAARVLQSKGFTNEQAEGIAEQMNQLLVHDLATKSDLKAVEAALTVKIYTVGFAVVALVVAAQKLL